MKKINMEIEYPTSTQLLLKIGGIIMVSIGLFLFKISFQLEYVQIIPLLFGSLFLILGIICFAEGFKIIIVNEKGVKQKNLIRQLEIPKEQIKGYAEIIHRNSKGTNTQLVIFTNTKNKLLKIEKDNWGDKYKLLLEKIKSDYEKVGFEEINHVTNQRKDLYKNIGKGFGIFVIIFGLYQLIFIDIIPPEKFQNLEVTISTQPAIQEKRKGRIESITYNVNEYSDFAFTVNGESFRMLYPKAKELKKGDKVLFRILKSEVQQKINTTISPDFKSKYVNWNLIDLYGIEYKEQVLLNIEDINNSRKNPIPKILLIFFGIGVIIYFKYVSEGHD